MTIISTDLESRVAVEAEAKPHPCLRIAESHGDDRSSPPAAASESRYRELFENAVNAVLFTRADGRIVDVNAAALELFGMTEEVMYSHRAHDLYANPDERDPAIANLEALGARSDFETWFRRHDGSVFRASLNSWVHRNADGETAGYWAIVRDVTDRRAAQARQSLLLRELDHRVRNNLAAIVGMARLMADRTPSLETFMERFVERIDSMRVAHELLGSTSWNGAEITELVGRLVQPCQLESSDRIRINGPRCDLPSHLACPLSMVIAELVTNAVKYGALSVPDGAVSIEWTICDRTLRLRWQELDGPPITATPTEGLGSELINGLVTHEMRGVVSRTFACDGLRAEISVPLENGCEATTTVFEPITPALHGPGTE